MNLINLHANSVEAVYQHRHRRISDFRVDGDRRRKFRRLGVSENRNILKMSGRNLNSYLPQPWAIASASFRNSYAFGLGAFNHVKPSGRY